VLYFDTDSTIENTTNPLHPSEITSENSPTNSNPAIISWNLLPLAPRLTDTEPKTEKSNARSAVSPSTLEGKNN